MKSVLTLSRNKTDTTQPPKRRRKTHLIRALSMIPDKCSNSQISEGLKVLSTTKERIELLDQILHERQNQQQSAFQDKMKKMKFTLQKVQSKFIKVLNKETDDNSFLRYRPSILKLQPDPESPHSKSGASNLAMLNPIIESFRPSLNSPQQQPSHHRQLTLPYLVSEIAEYKFGLMKRGDQLRETAERIQTSFASSPVRPKKSAVNFTDGLHRQLQEGQVSLLKRFSALPSQLGQPMEQTKIIFPFDGSPGRRQPPLPHTPQPYQIRLMKQLQ